MSTPAVPFPEAVIDEYAGEVLRLNPYLRPATPGTTQSISLLGGKVRQSGLFTDHGRDSDS
jgi:hypothetical protein